MERKKINQIVAIGAIVIILIVMFLTFRKNLTIPGSVTNLPVNTKPQATLQTFNDDTYKVSFKYSSPLEAGEPRYSVGQFFSSGGSQNLTNLIIPKTAYPDTNFYQAFFSFSVQPNAMEAECWIIQQDGASSPAQILQRQVNGRTYTFAQVSGAAAGTLSRTDVYHTFVNGRCYEASLNLFQGNIYNYPAGSIKQVDELDVYAQMESALNTLTIK